jgi:putative oxidoreductase
LLPVHAHHFDYHTRFRQILDDSTASVGVEPERCQLTKFTSSLVSLSKYLETMNPYMRVSHLLGRSIVSTDDSTAAAILRPVLGVIFFAHGAQKMLGWCGGSGFSGTMGFFTSVMHIPAPLAFLVIAAEFFGGLGLITSFLTRIAALGVAINMVAAIATVHRAFGLFMNRNGNQRGERFEFHLLVLAITAFLMIRGAGAFSEDRAILTKWPSPSYAEGSCTHEEA